MLNPKKMIQRCVTLRHQQIVPSCQGRARCQDCSQGTRHGGHRNIGPIGWKPQQSSPIYMFDMFDSLMIFVNGFFLLPGDIPRWFSVESICISINEQQQCYTVVQIMGSRVLLIRWQSQRGCEFFLLESTMLKRLSFQLVHTSVLPGVFIESLFHGREIRRFLRHQIIRCPPRASMSRWPRLTLPRRSLIRLGLMAEGF